MRLEKKIKKSLRLKLKVFSFKYFYKDFKLKLISDHISGVRIQSTTQTLNEIEKCIEKNERGAYLRFGDGDVYLLNNESDAFQVANKRLAIEMRETFLINGEKVFKSLAIHSSKFGFEKGMFDGNHKNSDKLSISLLEASYMFFIGQKIYSPVALHFTATENPKRANNFLKLLKSKTKLFVGNENLSDETIFKLFGDVKRINTPSKNSFNEIDRIYKECIGFINAINDFHVVVVAMGCSGRPLMKQIFNNSNKLYFLFDFGSLLDGIDNYNSRTWLKVTKLDKITLLEGL